ncbi:Nudix family hydrolase [Marinobacter caseinilyticus]|uniref:Nudix family hydrolase n=1 Tax=Marinobacter caseinilyticus TaxID=2692195 RepID=UPI00140952E6|nr:Nudix family hydrolase [Marinobacter caseinilyticus]
MTEVHVAVAVIRRQGQVLIARRPDHTHQGGLLEFPGGKVEPGESVQCALVREIAEETGLTVPAASLWPVIGVRHDYGDKRVFLDVWGTDEASGQPQGREGQDIMWQAIDALQDDEFPAANRPIIRALRLPRRYAITGPFGSTSEGLARLQRQLDLHCPDLVLLRAPWLSTSAYESFARDALVMCREAGVALILHGDPAMLAHVSAAGIHLPWRLAETLQCRPVSSKCWFSVSCHNAAEVAHAADLSADFITLGAVKPTASHPGRPALTWPEFQTLVDAAPLPVFALGGMIDDDLEQALVHGAQGIAGISNWW